VVPLLLSPVRSFDTLTMSKLTVQRMVPGSRSMEEATTPDLTLFMQAVWLR
jgi:hypothetical protein